jgi:DNA processing protein
VSGGAWRIPDARLDALLDGVGRPVASADERDDLIARALWHVVAEPGDAAVGALADGAGLAAAARALVDGADPSIIMRLSRGELGAEASASALRRWTPRLRAGDVVRALELAGRVDARMLAPDDDAWPDGLAALGPHRPHLLWVRGNSDLLRAPSVALVGARAATGYGEHVAMELAAGLCSRDIVVVSGGAYGIDGAAHRAALAAQGHTVAVLAGGPDRLYPSGHDALLRRVIEQGAVVSETPAGTPPTRWRFLQRNRVIAALSEAVVVVEAGHRSGALNTAHHAATAGVPLGVVPGPITSAASAGCHRLLREVAAQCVTSIGDIVELAFGGCESSRGEATLSFSELGTDTHDTGAAPAAGGEAQQTRRAGPTATRVADALRPRRWQSVDELARASGLAVAEVQAALGLLQFDDRAVESESGQWRRPSPKKQGHNTETPSPKGG